MTVAQWQMYGEDTALRVGAVGCLDGAMVHGDDHLTEVESDTRALNMHGT